MTTNSQQYLNETTYNITPTTGYSRVYLGRGRMPVGYEPTLEGRVKVKVLSIENEGDIALFTAQMTTEINQFNLAKAEKTGNIATYTAEIKESNLSKHTNFDSNLDSMVVDQMNRQLDALVQAQIDALAFKLPDVTADVTTAIDAIMNMLIEVQSLYNTGTITTMLIPNNIKMIMTSADLVGTGTNYFDVLRNKLFNFNCYIDTTNRTDNIITLIVDETLASFDGMEPHIRTSYITQDTLTRCRIYAMSCGALVKVAANPQQEEKAVLQLKLSI